MVQLLSFRLKSDFFLQEREKKKMEYENQINRISNQLEYEKKREEALRQNVEKFERTVQVSCSMNCPAGADRI